ncbi:MAG TPA: FGGY family carbohydrate kinase [Dinghuibacter sp.]|uniref:xylulokinase n=1 Tax=Dinghuibacter sp. TaxID=2024697 RepID=UPI002C018AEE|nr:FGGY family carbohydrate kinase [Dinghuibacter sp.]HTJ14587.1 FGGY family carbohydrate kinase [Dinghuibacter sp.]
MLLLGIDLGTSSIKVSIVDARTQQCVASARYPDTESAISTPKPGWAEQDPGMWWDHVGHAIKRALGAVDPSHVGAIGIAYQMHGLVVLDKDGNVLRPSIIWCDSRAVETGNAALEAIGRGRALNHLLNSPGNFTASKLGWVKANEPKIYERVSKAMLPGDYIAYKLTGEQTTSISALSEGIFWDFKEDHLSEDVFTYFGFDTALIPEVRPVFSEHGRLGKAVAAELGLSAGIPVTYKAGDQPNNALSLNVLKPGEVAATAGTSGVIYGVTDQLLFDVASRVNTFAHVNYLPDAKRLGVLLCINGTGILNRWIRDQIAPGLSYEAINREAASIAIGSEGVRILPFGNGAERMLGNRLPGAQIHGLNLNKHTRAHLFRAAQEGIAFSFRYGLDILRENGMRPSRIRAGMANLFLSDVFTDAFVQITGVPVDLYRNDGSVGAALGAGIGVKAFANESDAFSRMEPVRTVLPTGDTGAYERAYNDWLSLV